MQKIEIASAIDEQYAQSTPNSTRSHIGISQIGKKCQRALWYSFNKCTTQSFEGRMLRLFQFGHDIEPQLAKLLESVGFRVYLNNPINGEQYHVQDPDNYFFSGSLDAVAVSPADVEFEGVKPSTPYIVDFKTSNQNSFNRMVKYGLEFTRVEYYNQLQCYMGFSEQLGKKKVTDAMIFVINKNNHEIYTETIVFDDAVFQSMREKAKFIVESEKPPYRINEDKDSFDCRLCEHKDICHNKFLAEISCRNCGFHKKSLAHGEKCEKGFGDKPCSNHVYNPFIFDGDFIPVKFHEQHDAMEFDCFINGPHKAKGAIKIKDKPVLTSKELYDLHLDGGDEETIKEILSLTETYDASFKVEYK